MRTEASHSQPCITHPALDKSRSQLPSHQPPATEQRAMISLPMIRTLQSQVDCLWHEMRRLCAERPDSEAPPSFAEQDASHHSEGGQPEVYNAV